MALSNLILPKDYTSKLDIIETEIAIKLAKDTFERELASALSLTRVSAPLFVQPETGLNDDLNGVERPVQFDVADIHADVKLSIPLPNGSAWRSPATGSAPIPASIRI